MVPGTPTVAPRSDLRRYLMEKPMTESRAKTMINDPTVMKIVDEGMELELEPEPPEPELNWRFLSSCKLSFLLMGAGIGRAKVAVGKWISRRIPVVRRKV